MIFKPFLFLSLIPLAFCNRDNVTTVQKLFVPLVENVEQTSNKVTVVGCGQVGMAVVFSLLSKGITNNVALVDVLEDKLKGEMMDLEHGSVFLENAKVRASTDYAITAGSKVCIITAGVRRRGNETRLDLVQRNTEILKSIVPKLVKYNPDCIMLIASNPLDILTYVTWKLSGLPKNRVFGSGTNLDSARFRFLLSEKFDIAPTSVHGYIIGEHGDSSVPIWSGVNIGGVRLASLNPEIGTDSDPEGWNAVHADVVKSAYEVSRLKGYTSWAIGLSVAELTNAVLTNARTVHPVSTYVNGQYGVDKDVFLSLPAVLGSNGVSSIVRLPLTNEEQSRFQQSAQVIANVQDGIKF